MAAAAGAPPASSTFEAVWSGEPIQLADADAK